LIRLLQIPSPTTRLLAYSAELPHMIVTAVAAPLICEPLLPDNTSNGCHAIAAG
jgi:hypothetical protein